jgi:hypothetical protein
MKANIAEKVRGWVCGRILEPSSWAAVAAVLIGLSLMLTITWLMWVGIAAAVVALVIRERGNG